MMTDTPMARLTDAIFAGRPEDTGKDEWLVLGRLVDYLEDHDPAMAADAVEQAVGALHRARARAEQARREGRP